MKRNLVFLTLIISYLGFTSSSHSQQDGSSRDLAARPPDQQSAKTQHAKGKPGNPEVALFNQLKALLEPVGITVNKSSLIDVKKIKTIRELTIKWEAYSDVPVESLLPAHKVKDRPVGKTMNIVKLKKQQDTPAQLYGLQLTPEQLFIAGVDPNLRLKWWTLINDPRIIRSETVGPNGELSGETFYRAQPELFISLPDTEQITELWILQPQWSGSEFTLELLTRLRL